MNTPGRTVTGWWNCHNNAFYLERLVRRSAAEEPPESRLEANAEPVLGLLWRPISFPKSASARARLARVAAVPPPREGAGDASSSDAGRGIGGRRDRGARA